MKSKWLVISFIVIFLTSMLWAQDRLFRFPDVHGDKIVFTYAGDLWLGSTSGGPARKLTNSEGIEFFARFSPDGKWIAFTGQYDGNRDVYVMPAEGGVPKRLTFYPDAAHLPDRMGYDDLVFDWTPDGEKILFRSQRESFNAWLGRLYLIDKKGGYPEPLPFPYAGFACYSPDGKKLALNRIFRDFRTWKHYKGGQQQDIYIWDFTTNTSTKITDYEGMDHIPMWYGNRIYFVSDRSGRANIFCYDLDTRETRQITFHDEYDVNWPALGDGKIVYENGGFIYLLDLSTEKTHKVPLTVKDDRVLTRPHFKKVDKYITEIAVAPGGKRGLIVARGEVFTVPQKNGNTRNLTQTSGAHERGVNWSPDGKWISFISDKSGEDEIYLIPQDGKGETIQLTRNSQGYRFMPVWSPDGKKLAFADKNLKLYIVDVETHTTTFVDSARRWEIRHYNWSPDSRWLVYAKPEDNGFNSLYLYSLNAQKSYKITTDFTDDYNPVFGPDGKYLFFISERDYNPMLGNYEMSYVYQSQDRIYVMSLQANQPSPFAPESDEVEVKSEENQNNGKNSDGKKEKGVRVKVDFPGIAERVVALPIKPGNYSNLKVAGKRLFYASLPIRGLNGPVSGKTELKYYDLDKKKEATFMSGVSFYDISPDGKYLIYKHQNTVGIVQTTDASHKPGDGKIDLSGLEMYLNPMEEWQQIFQETWRLERDYFYVPNMVGVDWPAVRKMYAKLIPAVSHRFDLNYILGEMVAELHTSHAYVGGGDMPKPREIPVALLGARLTPDRKANRYRISKILKGENWIPNRRSPLTEPGIQVKEGDYLIAIDGQDVTLEINPYRLLQNKADQIVTISVNSKPTTKGAREYQIKPVKSEFDLNYLTWVEHNRKYVEEKTNGQVGYVHIPDMGANGLNQFVKMYYAQLGKKAIIIDVRFNGGGFVSQMILERLRRIVAGLGKARNQKVLETYPDAAYNGHLVCLANEYSASDGDIFPYFFKYYKLGPLVGKRTWGGVIGIRGYNRLVDGGYITRPEFATLSKDAQWIIEGHGVEPDIEVDNRLEDLVAGRDPQLDKAIELTLKMIQEDPREMPKLAPYPKKP